MLAQKDARHQVRSNHEMALNMSSGCFG